MFKRLKLKLAYYHILFIIITFHISVGYYITGGFLEEKIRLEGKVKNTIFLYANIYS